jgi:Spy/CpxP family protein refolding chaperone
MANPYRLRNFWALLLALSLACPAAIAQEPPSGEAVGRPGPAAQERASRRETVRLYLVHRMREALSLTDAQTLKVMDVLEELDRARQDHQTALRGLAAQLKTGLADPATPDSLFRDIVAKARKEQEEFEATTRGLDGRLLEILTPRQQAQFILLRRQLLEELRQEVAPPPREGRPEERWRR